jgi:Arc/MetJ-type ribon-helix-helix transcriptional regulator
MSNQEWGNVRLRNSLIGKIEGVVAGDGQYNSVSDFVSQKLSLALRSK